MDLVKLSGSYDAELYHLPYWQGDIVLNETIYPLEEEDAALPPIPLMYHADEIIALRSSDLETLYSNGKDYVCENGKIRILKEGSIPTIPYSDFYFKEEKPGESKPMKKGGFTLHKEGANFHEKQLCITYRHSDPWCGPVPKKKGDLLPILQKRLEEKSPLKIVMYGDSITWGANSSGPVDAKPFIPKWADMFPQEIERIYGCHVEVYNTAVGGKNSNWGRENVEERVVSYHPDLVVIGFGMNDGSQRVPVEEYRENIMAMIDAIRQDRPDSSILVLNSIMPNTNLVRFHGLQEEYAPILQEIENSYEELAFTNITELHKYMLSRKRYHDMTGNNVNHVNDFSARLYSQALLATIEK